MRKLLIIGEHPNNNSGFGHLHGDIIDAFNDLGNFAEITSLGTMASVSAKTPDTDCISINNSSYCTTKGNIFGRDAMIKFLSSNRDYTDVLCIGDQWYYDGVPYAKALFGNQVAFHYYCPCEGEGLPSVVVSQSNTLDPKVNIKRILRSFDQIITYSKIGSKAIEQLSPSNITDYVYHWTSTPDKDMEEISAIAKAIEGYKIVGFIGRNVFRKSTDMLLKVAEQLRGTNIKILAHVPKTDTHGWDLEVVKHQYPNSWDNIIFTEDLIPGLFYQRTDNKLVRNLKSGLKKKHLEWLYTKFDLFINMSRAEGFGFPIIEAMIRGIPTIVNGYSSPKEIMAQVGTHDMAIPPIAEELFPLGVSGKMGIPDVNSFVKMIKKLIDSPSLLEEIKNTQYKAANTLFLKENSKHRTKLVSIIQNYKHYDIGSDKIIPISIDSYMNKCGIKTYVDNLFGIDYKYRIREKNIKEISDSLEFVNNRIFHIQYEPAMWPLVILMHLLRKLSHKNKIVVTIHTENKEFMKESQEIVSHYIFHKEPSVTELPKDKYTVIPHPIPEYAISKGQTRKELGYTKKHIVIGLNGFALPYKKLSEQAVPIMQLIIRQPDTYRLLMVCSPHEKDAIGSGERIIQRINEFAKHKGIEDKVKTIYEFLPSNKMSKYLSAMDFALMYHNLSTVGAQSGSIRELIGSEVIPIVTRSKTQSMHDDLIDSKIAIAIQSKDKNTIEVGDFTGGAISAIENYGDSDHMITIKSELQKYKKTNTFANMAEKQQLIYQRLQGEQNE